MILSHGINLIIASASFDFRYRPFVLILSDAAARQIRISIIIIISNGFFTSDLNDWQKPDPIYLRY
jgi:hypothetical protein